MILSEMFHNQEKLDKYIMDNVENKMSLNELYSDRILALIVELSEVANASRCFKYWSKKHSESRERILDEFADVMHFILSLGNLIDVDSLKTHNYEPVLYYSNTVDQLIFINKLCAKMQGNEDYDVYVNIMENFLGLVILMGFEFKELEMAYYKKSEINYKRQDNNY